jgi:hypothetical protein
MKLNPRHWQSLQNAFTNETPVIVTAPYESRGVNTQSVILNQIRHLRVFDLARKPSHDLFQNSSCSWLRAAFTRKC